MITLWDQRARQGAPIEFRGVRDAFVQARRGTRCGEGPCDLICQGCARCVNGELTAERHPWGLTSIPGWESKMYRVLVPALLSALLAGCGMAASPLTAGFANSGQPTSSPPPRQPFF